MNLECGFHAVRLSIAAQHPDLSVPSLDELREAFQSMEEDNKAVGMDQGNTDNFSVDQLGGAVSRWAAKRGVKCQLGYVSEGKRAVLVNTNEVTAYQPGVKRVWVWIDEASLYGGIGHYEGLKRPDGEEGKPGKFTFVPGEGMITPDRLNTLVKGSDPSNGFINMLKERIERNREE